MSFWIMVPLAALVFYSGLLVVNFRKSYRGSQVNAWFSLYLISMSVWSLGSMLARLDLPGIDTLFWNRVLTAGSSAMPFAFWGFVQFFLNRAHKRLLIFSLFFFILIEAANFFGLVIISANSVDGMLINQYGPGVILAGFSWPLYIGLSAFQLAREFHNTRDSIYRNRIKYLIAVIIVIFLGGMTNISRLSVYPIDIGFNVISAFLIGYAILRYHLLDLSVVIRKSLLYSLPTLFIGALYFLSINFIWRLFTTLTNQNIFFLSLLVAMLSALAVQPIHDKAQFLVDRLFFREKHDIGLMLQRVSRTASTVLDINQLTRLILKEINSNLHVSRSAFFLKSYNQDEFELFTLEGWEIDPNLRFREDHPIVEWLAANDRAISRTDIEVMPVFVSLWMYEREALTKLGSELFIPVKAKGNLVGILAIGPKRSEETYSLEDHATLLALADQTAVAIENARLFAEATQRSQEMTRLNKVIQAELSERLRTEAALIESEQRFRSMFDKHGAIMLLIEPESGQILDANAAAQEFYGYTRETLKCMKIEDINTSPPVEIAEIHSQAVLGHNNYFIFPQRLANLEIRAVEVHSTPILIGGKTILFSIIHDITVRKRIEEALRESEEKFSKAFNSSPIPLYISRESDGYIIECNDAFTKLTRYSYTQILSKTSLDLDLWITLEDRKKYIQELNKTSSIRNFVTKFRIRNDRIITTLISSELIYINGESCILTVLYDITERERAEMELRQRLIELEAVNRISTRLRTAQTSEEMLPLLLDETLAATESDTGAIWLCQPDGELRTAVARGWLEELKDISIKPGEDIPGTVISSGKTYLTREFSRDPLTSPVLAEYLPIGWGGICVPIRAAADIAGVMIISMQLPHEFTLEQTKLIDSLAEMAGTALHRLRLFEETRQRLEYLQALQTVDRAITATLDSRITLNILLEQVILQLKLDAAGVLLLNPYSLTLEYTAGRGFHTRIYEQTLQRLGDGLAGQAALERRRIRRTEPFDIRDTTGAQLLQSERFIGQIAIPLIAKGEIKGVLEVFHRSPLQPNAEWFNFLETLADQAAIAIDNFQLFENLQRSNIDLRLAYDATIEGWSHALDLRDKETEGHTQRVKMMAAQLARAVGMTEEEIVQVQRGALLHDIGKMGIPDSILLKPGKLTEEEMIIMRKHPIFAYEFLSPIHYLKDAAIDIAYCHHEKWDGTGYPRGLKGEQIPLSARLFSVIDVWDALSFERPYRGPWLPNTVREYIKEQSGTFFDPTIVELFFRIFPD